MFEDLLGLPQRLVVLERVQVSQHAHDAREAVHLTDVEELERLHLEAEAGIDQHQNLEGREKHNAFNLTSFSLTILHSAL